MYGQLMAGGKQFVHCREVVLLLECPLSEVLLYNEVTQLGHSWNEVINIETRPLRSNTKCHKLVCSPASP